MAYNGTFLFKSTDSGAPVLTGRAYSTAPTETLINLLNVVFVDGYNTQTSCSVTRTTNVATVAKTAHGFRDGAVVRHTGFDYADYNIDAKITVLDANSYTYLVANSPTTPGGTSGTAKVCPLDWGVHANNSTQQRAWQQPSDVGVTNRCWLSMYDALTGSARYRGYTGTFTAASFPSATLPDSDGGTSFPTVAQQSGGFYITRSSDSSSSARAWVVISDRRTIYVFIKYSTSTTCHAFSFGQITSYRNATDNWPTAITGNLDSANNGALQSLMLSPSTAWTSTVQGMHFAGAYNATGAGSIAGSKPVLYGATAGSLYPGHAASINYTAPIQGGLMLQRMIVVEATANTDIRGHMAGLWFPWHQRPLSEDTTFTGATGSDIDGRTFYVVGSPGTGGTLGQMFVELRDGSYWD